jgi:hypothetical protein
MTKQEVSDVIYNELCYMYCDNCRHNYEIEDDACDDCYRKYNGWGISRAKADYIANMICIGNAMPPIQIGTPVYFADVWQNGVEHGTVSMIQQKADKSWKFRISYGSSVRDEPTSEIGKTVFLTYEEAENYLKDKGEHKHDKDML